MSATELLAREPLSRGERRRWLLALAVLALMAVAFRWQAVDIGRLSDDYIQHAMIAGLYPGDGYAPFDLYAFARNGDPVGPQVDAGSLPWFVESGFHGAVLRPMASVLLWLDHTLAPDSVRLWHVHSLLWFGVSIVGFGLCVRRLLPRWPAVLALVFYACEAGFVSPLGWLANRCVLVCVTFGFLAIWAHIERREPEPDTPGWLRRYGVPIELALLSACLASGEYGLGIVAYVFAWELFAGPAGASPKARVLHVLRGSWPALAVAFTYLGAHTLLGYGTLGADVYADPISSPSAWLSWAKLRLPKLATAALWGVPASTIHVFRHPGAQWWNERVPCETPMEFHVSHALFALVGLAVAALALILARAGMRPDERRALRVVLVGAGLGLLPISVAPSHSRLLIASQLGACVSASLIVFACGRLLLGRDRDREGAEIWRGRARGAALLPAAAVMLWLNTVEDLRWTRLYLVHLDNMQASNAAAFTRGDLLEQELAEREVIIMNGPSQSIGMYGHFVLHAHGLPTPASWRSLALGGDHPLWVFRPSDRVLELVAIRGAWMRTDGELFFRRADQQLLAGSHFSYPGFEVEVVNDEGGDPTRVRFTFPHSLDDPRYLVLISTREGLMKWELPAIEDAKTAPRPSMPYIGDRDDLYTPRAGRRGPK